MRVDQPVWACHYGAMLGETKNPFPFARAALTVVPARKAQEGWFGRG